MARLNWDKASREEKARKTNAAVPKTRQGGRAGATFRDLSPEEVERLYPPPPAPDDERVTCRICQRDKFTVAKHELLEGHPPVPLMREPYVASRE